MKISAAVCLMAALLFGPAADMAEAVVQTRKLPPQQWSNRKVKIGEGVVFKLNDYIAATSIRNHAATKHLYRGTTAGFPLKYCGNDRWLRCITYTEVNNY